jgi:hypothetical protein
LEEEMSGSLSDLITIGYKRAVYAALILTSLTPGILYLYLRDRPLFESLGTAKTVLFGLAVASPVGVFNMAIAFSVIYLAFTRKQYQKGERLKEEVINRVILLSSMMATSLSLNSCVVALSFMRFEVSVGAKLLGLLADIAFVVIFAFLLKRKVDQDLFHHKFPG